MIVFYPISRVIRNLLLQTAASREHQDRRIILSTIITDSASEHLYKFDFSGNTRFRLVEQE